MRWKLILNNVNLSFRVTIQYFTFFKNNYCNMNDVEKIDIEIWIRKYFTLCDIFIFFSRIHDGIIRPFLFIGCQGTIPCDNAVSRFAVNYLFPHKIGMHSRWAKSHRVAGDWREAEQLGGARHSQYSANRLHVRCWCPSSSDGSILQA